MRAGWDHTLNLKLRQNKRDNNIRPKFGTLSDIKRFKTGPLLDLSYLVRLKDSAYVKRGFNWKGVLHIDFISEESN